jgi:hypothetical protein
VETDIQERVRAEIELAAENSIIINREYFDNEQRTRERQFEVLESDASLRGSDAGGGLSVSSTTAEE